MLFSLLTFFAVAHTGIPLQLQNFIQKLESQKGQLQGGAIAILHKGKVFIKAHSANEKERMVALRCAPYSHWDQRQNRWRPWRLRALSIKAS